MYVYDAKTFDVKSSLNVDSSVYSVAFSPDGTTLAAGCYQKIYFLDPTAGEIKSSLRGHTDRVSSVCFSSDGKKLTSGSEDSTVRNWDPATRASLS